MGDEVGGHHVSGHVHTTAMLRNMDQSDPNNLKLTFQVHITSRCCFHAPSKEAQQVWWLKEVQVRKSCIEISACYTGFSGSSRCGCSRRLQVPQQWMKYLLPKGFVAVDGCSLTV